MGRSVLKRCSALGLIAIVIAVALVSTDSSAVAARSHGATSSPWRSSTIAPAGTLADIGCLGTGHCVAVRSDGYTDILDHGHWGTPHRLVAKTAGLDAVQCTATTCTASINDTKAAVLHSGHWTMLPDFTPDKQYGQASCTSVKFCVAVGGLDNSHPNWFRIYRGTSWSKITPFYKGAVDSLTCLTSTFCAAADANGGAAMTFNGKSWHIYRNLKGDGFPNDMTCVSSTFCAYSSSYPFAGNANGLVYLYNGHTWTKAHTFTSGGDTGPISCAAKNLCLTMDDADQQSGKGGGHLITYNGHSWTTAPSPNHSGQLTSLSCSTTRFCALINTKGQALTRQYS